MSAPALDLSHPVFDALERSGVFGITADMTPDEVRIKLLALRRELAGQDSVTIALVREHVLRMLRDELHYADAATILTATLGRPDAGRSERLSVPPESAGLTDMGARGGLATRTADELLADETLQADAAWTVDGLLVRGVNIIFGSPKVGKSTAMTYVIRQIAAGERCFGRTVTPGPVLMIDLEQGPRLTRRKLADLHAACLAHPIHVYCGPVPSTVAVEAAIRATGATVLVIDSLSRFLQLEDENSNSEVTAALVPLIDLAQRLDICVCCIHHDRKSGGAHGSGMRGASAFLAVADVAIHVLREPGDEDSRRRLVAISRYEEANRTLIVNRTPDGYEVIGTPAEVRRRSIYATVREEQGTAEEIARRLELSRPAIIGDLKALVAEGLITPTGSGKSGDPYRYASVESLSDTLSLGGVTDLQASRAA